MSGTNAGIGAVAAAATVDPNPCNALRETGSGLLVPPTALEGVAPGTAVGGARSVDIDVVAPAGTDCPQEWQVGARLTPLFEESFLEAFIDLVPAASGTWVDSGLSVNLPENGVYEISATLKTIISANAAGGAYNHAIVARLFNVTSGNAIPNSQYTLQQNSDNNPPTALVSDSDVGHFERFLTVAAGAVVVRLEVMRLTSAGTPASTTGVLTGNTRLAFKKISD